MVGCSTDLLITTSFLALNLGRLSATVVICGRTPEHPMFRYSLFGILKKKLVIVFRTFLTFSQIQVGHSRFDRSLLMNYPLFSFHCKLTSVLFKIKFLVNLFIVKYCLQPAYNETLFPALECQRNKPEMKYLCGTRTTERGF